MTEVVSPLPRLGRHHRGLPGRAWHVALLVVSALLAFCGLLLAFATRWSIDFFGVTDINQIIYTLTQPLEGTDASQTWAFVRGPLAASLASTAILVGLVYGLVRLLRCYRGRTAGRGSPAGVRWFVALPLAVAVFVAGAGFSVHLLGADDVRTYFFGKSTIYENNYVAPADVDIVFPAQKRNLVYIFLESMENTYMSTDVGGAQPVNLIPRLTQIASDNI
ncbi:MAG: hypothetical protein LBB54_03265, partial [Cellulomonadaceae bacterium]|nr:hypothetical protein [Cellulomonadaceae bacterium]